MRVPFPFLLLAGWDADTMAGAGATFLDSGLEAMFHRKIEQVISWTPPPTHPFSHHINFRLLMLGLLHERDINVIFLISFIFRYYYNVFFSSFFFFIDI